MLYNIKHFPSDHIIQIGESEEKLNQIEIVLDFNEDLKVEFQNLTPGKYKPKLHLNVPDGNAVKKPLEILVHLTDNSAIPRESYYRIEISEEILKFLSSEKNWLELSTEGLASISLRWCRQKLKKMTLTTLNCNSSTVDYHIEADQTRKGWYFIILPSFEIAPKEVGKTDNTVLIANPKNQLNEKIVIVDQVVLEQLEKGNRSVKNPLF